MATRAKKKKESAVPGLANLEKQVSRLRKDLERNVRRAGREAASYLPKSSRRQLEDMVERVSDLQGDVAKRVTKTVKGVRADVEETVGDLRGTVDKRVRALRKEATEGSQKALENFEKEARKQVERVLQAVGLPTRSDLDGIKRRVGALERKVEQLVESGLRRRASESEAA